jgi:hypothetical protein
VTAAAIFIGVDRRGLSAASAVGRPDHGYDGGVVAKRGGDFHRARRLRRRLRKLESAARALGVQLVDGQLGAA